MVARFVKREERKEGSDIKDRAREKKVQSIAVSLVSCIERDTCINGRKALRSR